MSSAVATSKPARVIDMQEGETVNLSERGIYFKTAQKVKIGQAMELYFTLPRELTGRARSRCAATPAWFMSSSTRMSAGGREWARAWSSSSRSSDFAPGTTSFPGALLLTGVAAC